MYHVGILNTIIEVFGQWDNKKEVLDFVGTSDKRKLGKLLMEVLLASFHNNRKNKKVIFFNFQKLFAAVNNGI